MKKNKYALVEYEMMPSKVVMTNATIEEIADKLGYKACSCYPIGMMLGGKYRILREGEKVNNRFFDYFHGACYVIAKMIRKDKPVTEEHIMEAMEGVIKGLKR